MSVGPNDIFCNALASLGLEFVEKGADIYHRSGGPVLEGDHSQCGPTSRGRRAPGRFRVILELSGGRITFAQASGLVQARADGIAGTLQRERAYQATERAMQENGASKCLNCHQSADPNWLPVLPHLHSAGAGMLVYRAFPFSLLLPLSPCLPRTHHPAG